MLHVHGARYSNLTSVFQFHLQMLCATFLSTPFPVLFSLGYSVFTSISASPPGLPLSLFLKILQAQSTHRSICTQSPGAWGWRWEAKRASSRGLSQASSERNGHPGRQQNPHLQTSQSHNGDDAWTQTHLLIQQWCRVLIYFIHQGNARSLKPSLKLSCIHLQKDEF